MKKAFLLAAMTLLGRGAMAQSGPIAWTRPLCLAPGTRYSIGVNGYGALVVVRPLDCMQFLARLKRMLLLFSTVFFIIGPARGCPAFVVVDSYVSTPRLSNNPPAPAPLRTPNSALRTTTAPAHANR